MTREPAPPPPIPPKPPMEFEGDDSVWSFVLTFGVACKIIVVVAACLYLLRAHVQPDREAIRAIVTELLAERSQPAPSTGPTK